MQPSEDPKSPILAEESRTLDYHTPDRLESRTRGAWPGPPVWISLVLYGLSMVTPTMVARDPNDRLPAKVTMGWQTAFACIADWPAAIRKGGGEGLLVVFLAPSVNLMFIIALALAFAAARRGPRSARFDRAFRTIAAICVPGAAIAVALLLVGIWFGNAWGPRQSRLSIGVFFWGAAYLLLGLRYGLRRGTMAG